MDKELRDVGFWYVGVIGALLAVCLIAAGIGRVAGLFWFPWEIQMQTGMIRASNSYITTQQAALRQFRGDYDSAATDGQRAAIVRQMQQIADTIPGNVQPDIASFLASH